MSMSKHLAASSLPRATSYEMSPFYQKLHKSVHWLAHIFVFPWLPMLKLIPNNTFRPRDAFYTLFSYSKHLWLAHHFLWGVPHEFRPILNDRVFELFIGIFYYGKYRLEIIVKACSSPGHLLLECFIVIKLNLIPKTVFWFFENSAKSCRKKGVKSSIIR